MAGQQWVQFRGVFLLSVLVRTGQHVRPVLVLYWCCTGAVLAFSLIKMSVLVLYCLLVRDAHAVLYWLYCTPLCAASPLRGGRWGHTPACRKASTKVHA